MLQVFCFSGHFMVLLLEKQVPYPLTAVPALGGGSMWYQQRHEFRHGCLASVEKEYP